MERFTGDDGYTLAELLVVVAILAMVAGAIVGFYEVSLQGYTRASSLEDAQIGARAGVDRMASELRLIGAYWNGANGAGAAVTAATSTSITFMADVNGDSVVNGVEATVGSNPNSTTITIDENAPVEVANAFNAYTSSALNDFVYIANGAAREVRQIATVAGRTITLATALTSTYPPTAIVRSVEIVTYNFNAGTNSLTRSVGGSGAQTILDNVTGLTLTYFDVNGNPTANPALIREIQISLTTQGNDGSRRTMASRVRVRNLQ